MNAAKPSTGTFMPRATPTGTSMPRDLFRGKHLLWPPPKRHIDAAGGLFFSSQPPLFVTWAGWGARPHRADHPAIKPPKGHRGIMQRRRGSGRSAPIAPGSARRRRSPRRKRVHNTGRARGGLARRPVAARGRRARRSRSIPGRRRAARRLRVLAPDMGCLRSLAPGHPTVGPHRRGIPPDSRWPRRPPAVPWRLAGRTALARPRRRPHAAHRGRRLRRAHPRGRSSRRRSCGAVSAPPLSGPGAT